MTDDSEQIETIAEPLPAVPQGPPHVLNERFAPGALLASRYRIISPLGKGGMGEVFRADDLILRQQVALKFLPESARTNLNLLTRFYDEVRIARQISHKNVCRVYDIGEVNGQPYLSMEYIDGEDLGSLLRRIGRLPADKATEFARKLCAGVAAAHNQGVLHRDLKPANIMIDSRGELRVTDFGLAAIAEQLKGDEIRNGTPAYMAPEQLTGAEVSAQSDLYAVGLILYEMFTGKMPFEASTIAEMTRLRQENRVTSPSTLTRDLDDAVERAILRCLDSDPKMRPASAMALSAMLPGGDPLAAALADGITPSPEVVAEAGSHEALSPRVAIPILAGIILGLIAFCVAIPRFHLMNLVPLENPPEVLTAKARDILKNLGYTDRAVDSTADFFGEAGVINFARSKGHNMEEWGRLFSQPPSAIGYWYRQASAPLVSENISSEGKADIGDPPVNLPGMLTVVIDLDGSLRRFAAVPPEHEVAPLELKPPDWARLFSAANLDPAKFTSVAPEWSSSVMTDARFAWTGLYKDRADLPVRIEAASFHNRPVYFQVLWPWTPAARLAHAAPNSSRTLRSVVNYVIGAIVFIAALWIAHYNWKAGRADLRGATRVGIFCGAMSLIAWIFFAHHVASDAEQTLVGNALANAAYICLECWLIYLALEPWVRRYWPQSMITWSRVVAGKWTDPVVGRDLLFGTLFGIVYVLILALYEYANFRSGVPMFGEFSLENLNGFRAFAGYLAVLLFDEVKGALTLLLTLFLVRAVLKKQWIAGTLWVAGWVAERFLRQNFIDSPQLAVTTGVFWTLLFSLLVFILLRFGFFALVVAFFVLDSLIASFLTTDFSAWYGQTSFAIAIVIVAMALRGFRLSLGSRPLFSPAVPNET
jgi:serine/threonine protein kinase